MNVVVISGGLGKDPEFRQTQGGSSVLSFSVAVSDRRRNGQEWEDVTHWVDVVMFGKRAESLSKILRKGMKVTVGGKLSQSRWEDRNGNKRSKLEVIASDVDLPPRGSRNGSDGGYGGNVNTYTGGGQYGPQNVPQQPTGYSQDVYDSDIPW